MKEPFLCIGQSQRIAIYLRVWKYKRCDRFYPSFCLALLSQSHNREVESKQRDPSLSEMRRGDAEGSLGPAEATGVCGAGYRRGGDCEDGGPKRWHRVSLSDPSWKLLSACAGGAWQAQQTAGSAGQELPRNMEASHCQEKLVGWPGWERGELCSGRWLDCSCIPLNLSGLVLSSVKLGLQWFLFSVLNYGTYSKA